jgi:hypothetical protein
VLAIDLLSLGHCRKSNALEETKFIEK